MPRHTNPGEPAAASWPTALAPTGALAGRRARLEVYVAAHCHTCIESRVLAREVAARFPDVEVAVIDLDAGGRAPEPVVAVPTYLLNGKVLWMGNPAPEELFDHLSADQRQW